MNLLNTRWFAILVPALIGAGLAALCVRLFSSYGWSLFVGLPIVVSFLSAFCTAFRRDVRPWPTYGIAMLSLLCVGGFILCFALDGLICLLMALPLALVLGLIGSMLGWLFGRSCQKGSAAALPIMVAFMFPALVGFERQTRVHDEPLRRVVTSVQVHAPINRVWQKVIAFPKITEPATGIFDFGIAYPIEAHIEGSGPGAIRRCVFSTGSFVEPITRWEEPTLLTFDVIASPPPLRELSIYKNLQAPHLHGQMVSRHGQFRLTQDNGSVTLEGTTWYTHSLAPQWYWGPVSDYIIHRIHQRVLEHIKRVSEQS